MMDQLLRRRCQVIAEGADIGQRSRSYLTNAVKTTRSIFNPRGAAAEWAEAATAELTWVLG